jgi:hypothetical protein
MRFFYDTEFLERGPQHPIELISVAVVDEEGREFFAANRDFDRLHAEGPGGEFVRVHVLPKLPPLTSPLWMERAEIARRLEAFVERPGNGEPPEFWGSYAAYDHVVLCQLFGSMSELPAGWPMFTRDFEQLRETLANPRPTLPPRDQATAHDAMADARWLRAAWLSLQPTPSRR